MFLRFQHVSEVVSDSEALFLESYFGEHYPYLFHMPTGMPEYVYYNDFTWIDIWSIEKESLDLHRTFELINQTNMRLENFKKNNDYRFIFSFIDKRISFHLFQINFYLIPKEQRYEIFRYIYTKVEYDFDKLKPEFLKEVFALREFSEDHKRNMLDLKSKSEPDGSFIIFRGECSKSSSIEKAWSWTLSYETALFFATRFNKGGIIYQSKVSYEDISDYLTGRDEEEILINPINITTYTKETVSKPTT
jgi:hypothetical protein